MPVPAGAAQQRDGQLARHAGQLQAQRGPRQRVEEAAHIHLLKHVQLLQLHLGSREPVRHTARHARVRGARAAGPERAAAPARAALRCVRGAQQVEARRDALHEALPGVAPQRQLDARQVDPQHTDRPHQLLPHRLQVGNGLGVEQILQRGGRLPVVVLVKLVHVERPVRQSVGVDEPERRGGGLGERRRGAHHVAAAAQQRRATRRARPRRRRLSGAVAHSLGRVGGRGARAHGGAHGRHPAAVAVADRARERRVVQEGRGRRREARAGVGRRRVRELDAARTVRAGRPAHDDVHVRVVCGTQPST